jgi:hypothetical protein
MIILSIFHLFNGLYKALGITNQYFPQYNNGIFFWVGLASFILPFVFAALYYLVANGFENFDALRKTSHWWLFFGINLILVLIITLLVSKNQTQLGGFDSFMYLLSIVNIAITSLVFFCVSLWLKRYSKHAQLKPFKRIPFYTPK